jgi:hypothetical protein
MSEGDDGRSDSKVLLGQAGTQRGLRLRRKSEPTRDLPAPTTTGIFLRQLNGSFAALKAMQMREPG